jgi:glycerol kinase
MEIWESVLTTARNAIAKAKINPTEIAATGITNQRETVVVWERKTGMPVHRAIVWQDRRTGEAMNALRESVREALVQEKTGLLLDPYFSASKIRWMFGEGTTDKNIADAGLAIEINTIIGFNLYLLRKCFYSFVLESLAD